MKEFLELTETLARIISENENQRKKVGAFIKESNELAELPTDDEILESKFVYSVEPSGLIDMRIAGIDGGLVKKSFHGIDLMLLRAVGVIFNYQNGKLSVEYYPEAIPSPTPRVVNDPLDDLGFDINSNIERQIIEITTATEVLEKYEPDILLLNGSVIPHYSFVPEKGSLVEVNYKNMIEAYNKLFAAIRHRKTILAGAIEDSKGTRFCEVMSRILNSNFSPNMPNEIRIVLNQTRDTNLLSYILTKGERSFVFPYSIETTRHPILREFPDVASKIFTFYLRTAEFDSPIRVDFFGDKGTVDIANKISSILLPLAAHDGYGTPSVIIEADQRAKLSEKDLEMFYLDIMNKTGNIVSLVEQRRNQRPF